VTDDPLGNALRSLWATADPVPEAVLRAGFDAIGWRDPDAALARLRKEAGAEQTLAHVRGGPPRLLTFVDGDVTIVLEVATGDGDVRLLGQLDPMSPAAVTVESRHDARTVPADARGRFTVDRLHAGWTRVVVAFAATPQARVTTEWFKA
jgi:hypothetical protein